MLLERVQTMERIQAPKTSDVVVETVQPIADHMVVTGNFPLPFFSLLIFLHARTHNVILKDAEDWSGWIEVIKSVESGNYKLEEPASPIPATVKAGARGISELGEDGKDEYKSLKKGYDRSVIKYEARRRGLGTIQTKIQETVTRSNLQYTFRKDSPPYDMLVALRDRYARQMPPQ